MNNIKTINPTHPGEIIKYSIYLTNNIKKVNKDIKLKTM